MQPPLPAGISGALGRRKTWLVRSNALALLAAEGRWDEPSSSDGWAMNAWIALWIAIVAEVIGTLALKASEGLTRLGPSVLVVAGYGAAFYFLALALKTIPVGVVYAVWSGAGLALITLAAWFLFDQALDGAALGGLVLILAGIVVLQCFSKAAQGVQP